MIILLTLAATAIVAAFKVFTRKHADKPAKAGSN